MKKSLLCIILCAALALSAIPALGTSYSDELAYPAHVRALKAAYDEGEYGGEVFQLFARNYLQNKGHLITISEKEGVRVNTDLYAVPETYVWSTSRHEITAEKYQSIKDYVNQSGFDYLPDYVNYGQHDELRTYDFYYTHITPDGISYVRMDDPGADSGAYAGLVKLMFELTGDMRWFESSEDTIEYRIEQLKKDYDNGLYGDEVYQLTENQASYVTRTGPTIIISVKDGQAIITTPSRDRKRVLTADEYQRFAGHIGLYDFDNLPSVVGDNATHGWSYSYTHITPDGVSYVNMTHPNYQRTYEYAKLASMILEFYEAGGFEPVDGPLWGSVTEKPEPVKIRVNGLDVGEGRAIDAVVHAGLTPALLDGLGIKSIERPDLSSVVLCRGTNMLLFDRGQSYMTEIETSGFGDPRELAAKLLAENAANTGFVNIAPMGTTVVKGRIPLRAVVEAFGGIVTWNGDENCVDITIDNSVGDLSDEYVNVLISLLLEEDEEAIEE